MNTTQGKQEEAMLRLMVSIGTMSKIDLVNIIVNSALYNPEALLIAAGVIPKHNTIDSMITELLRADLYVDAIKTRRQAYDEGLKVAKEAVDAIPVARGTVDLDTDGRNALRAKVNECVGFRLLYIV